MVICGLWEPAHIDYTRFSLSSFVATQLFLSGREVIMPRRPLSVRTVPDAEATRVGIRRERWHAEAEKFLDPSVMSLFSRRGASDGTPVTNPLSEQTMLISEATPVDNADADELIKQVRWCLVGFVWKVCGGHTGMVLQLTALPTVTELRSEAAMLASEAEKASLQAQHRMREHGWMHPRVRRAPVPTRPPVPQCLSCSKSWMNMAKERSRSIRSGAGGAIHRHTCCIHLALATTRWQVAIYCKAHGVSESSDEGGALMLFRQYDADGNRRLNKEEFFEFYKGRAYGGSMG